MKSTVRFIFVIALSYVLAAPTGQGSDRIPDQAPEMLRKLQPKLSPAKAKRLADLFRRIAAEPSCGMPWQILVAIAFNESSLGVHTVNAKSGDFGMMQVNEKNILRYALSRDRLMKDAAYSIRFACKLLRDNKERYAQKHEHWLGIYRSGTALWKDHIRKNAQRYDRIIRETARKIGYSEEMHLVYAR